MAEGVKELLPDFGGMIKGGDAIEISNLVKNNMPDGPSKGRWKKGKSPCAKLKSE